MKKNPYIVLGLSPDADEQLLRATYEGLRTRYSEERFLDGDIGNEGARKLMELEDAWKEISADLQRRQSNQEFGGEYGEVDNLIKAGRYEDAQRLMDAVSVRTAEWHYYQSIIYYKRDWLTESRKQLAMAVSMDPNNAKYSEALNRLDSVMGNPNTSQQSMGPPPPHRNAADDTANTLCRCCQAYICMDCLCHLCTGCR